MDLRQEIVDMAKPSIRRNPDWSRDETVLLMDLYLSAPHAEKAHPEVIALSILLRAAGPHNGRAVLPSFRNPAGIAMRLRNFAKQDPDTPPDRNTGLRPGGAVDRVVWQEFSGDRPGLAREAARIRRSISMNAWSSAMRSSRGPAPSFGARSTTTVDGPAGVYLLSIEGPLATLAPSIIPRDEFHLVKLGRTVDLERRIVELSCGLPAASLIRYVPIGLRPFSSGGEAHRFERHLLDLCDQEGWSLGGEFAYAPLDRLKAALAGKSQLQRN